MPRVLKRGHFRFVERLHGGVQVDGRQIRLPPDPSLGIEHYSYRDIGHYLEKLNRYTSGEAARLAQSGACWDWRDSVRDTIRDLWMYYEYNPGKLDRERGWILSWLSGQYRWLARAKLIDLPSAQPDRPPPYRGVAPDSLDEVIDLWRRELSRLRAHHPTLPLGILWRSPLWDASGYADEARAFVKGLARGNRSVRVEEVRWSDSSCPLPPNDAALLRALSRVERPAHLVAITDCIPVLVEPDPHVAANILRTTFETDRLPEFWQPHLAKFNEIWVPSAHNLRAFRRSGIAPEKLRVVKSCCDTDIFHPDGPRLALPETLAGRFVFLSVFDWQWRKGWDVLLRAYCQEFLAGEPVGLLLKLTRAHGHTEAMIRSQADQVLAEFGLALVMRPDIVLWDTSLSTPEMAALYRSTSAFVLPSRGEGWGRPYMEAMACGLPTIGTRHLGSADFMSDDNSVLVDASLVAVHEAAAAEIPPYRGHRWYEPDLMGLRRAMRQVYEDEPRRSKLSAASAGHIASQFNVGKGGQAIEDALADTERQFERSELPAPLPHQVRVALEGEFFAHHSFANINEQLAWRLSQDQRLAVSLRRAYNQPTHDESIPGVWRLRPHFDRPLAGGPHVMIRHAFPPNWEPVGEAVWVHIQPWEFGYLPQDWLEPLKERVHEIWVPTRYVQHAYERSGIAGEKIQVIPWGIDPEVFSPDAEPLLLPTDRTFRFLFVGGTIGRKGIDTLLEAYLAEFTRHDDVCLVVKDLGVQTFYRFGNFREQILAARDNLQRPSIVYLDYHMTAGQLASLYTACQCLAAPYRAEGFGLPILEGMACGLAPIVPAGGASEDFTDPDTAFLLPSRQVETTHDWPLAGTPLELSVSVDDVRRMLRLAYEDRGRVKRVGEAASRFARTQFTWQKTVEKITNRLLELARPALLSTPATGLPPRHSLAASNDRPVVGTCIVAGNDQDELVRLLAHVRPFVDEAVVVLGSDCPRCAAIAEEYGAKIVTTLNRDDEAALRQAGLSAASAPWVFWLLAGDRLNDEEAERIRSAVVHQPDDVSEVVLELCRSQLVPQSGRMTDRLPVRRHRNNGAASSRPGSFHTGA